MTHYIPYFVPNIYFLLLGPRTPVVLPSGSATVNFEKKIYMKIYNILIVNKTFKHHRKVQNTEKT